MGTAFLLCPETKLTPAWQEALKSHRESDTTVTTVISGKPARGIRNRFIREVEALDESLLPYPAQYSLTTTLRQHAASSGHADFLAMWAGQGIGLIEEAPAADLICSWIDEFNRLSAGQESR